MVDEFQDTDPVQWKVIDRAFTGRSTLILIGDPKQAIYAFRGGDIVTYLDAAATAGVQKTLGTNWRSDARLGAIGCRWCSRVPNSGIRESSSTRSTRTMPGSRLRGAPSQRPVPAPRGAPGDVRPQRHSRDCRSAICARTSQPTWPPTSATC